MVLGVRAKFVLITVGILIFAIGIGSVVSRHVFLGEYSKALREKTFVVAENLRENLNKLQNMGIPVHELVGFERQCQDAVARFLELSYAMVVDPGGKILFQNDSSEALKEISRPDVLQAVSNASDSYLELWNGDEKYCDIYVPVFGLRDEHVATVRLGFPARYVSERISPSVSHSFLAFVVSLAFAVCLVVTCLHVWINRPLGRLLEVIREIIEGGPGTGRKVEVLSQDEIGQLASAFNRMIAELNSSHEKITRYSAELEEKVAERTARLEDMNARLQSDIVEKQRAQEALLESERRYRELADLLPQPVYETDPKGNLGFVNRALSGCFGYGREDFAGGVNLLDLVVEEDRTKILGDLYRNAETKNRIDLEYTAVRKDGSRFPLAISASLVFCDGAIAGLRGIMLDLTERKAAEEEQVKIQRLESLGILAGGIAHDFNNILTVIAGNVSLAESCLPPQSEASEILDEAARASRQAESLTRQLITFSTGGAPVKRTDSIKETLHDAVRFGLAGSKVKADVQTDPDLWYAEFDVGQMHQVITNLVVNAKEAMPDGGVVSVSATNEFVPAGRNPSLKEGHYIRISIRDGGVGIPAETLPKIFDPFFSTKDRGSQKGMGLGLTTCYSIVKKHEGDVVVESEPQRGTTVRVFLPALSPPAPERSAAKKAEPAPAGKGRVLMMDDEKTILKMVGKMMNRLGYDVETAQEGAEAIERYRLAKEQGVPFDVVILDLTVPGGMGGLEALKTLREMDPGLKAVVTTGYSNDPVVSNHADFGFDAAIIKPFRLRELGDTIQSLTIRKDSTMRT